MLRILSAKYLKTNIGSAIKPIRVLSYNMQCISTSFSEFYGHRSKWQTFEIQSIIKYGKTDREKERWGNDLLTNSKQKTEFLDSYHSSTRLCFQLRVNILLLFQQLRAIEQRDIVPIQLNWHPPPPSTLSLSLTLPWTKPEHTHSNIHTPTRKQTSTKKEYITFFFLNVYSKLDA